MGKRKVCPRCGNILFMEKEPDGWYEWCINCSYRNELITLVDSQLTPVSKNDPRSGYSPEATSARSG